MAAAFADRVSVHPPTSVLPRLRHSIWRQASRSAVCPDAPRAEGWLGLVTGGSRGIGLETSRGLAARGVEVISASRGGNNGKQAAEAMSLEFGVPGHFVPLDLGDLVAIGRTLDRLEAVLEGRRLDLLVANAGLWPRRHAFSAQGHEIAFGTNVLGHHALIRGALERGFLSERARVVVVTGDIYIMASECTADFRYRTLLGGQLAYCRSKLGNLWYVRELARRHPGLRVHAVHPGVIASELSGSSTGLVGVAKRALMLSPEQGAQTSLFCATQPDLASGSYYHNILGRVELHPEDPAADGAKAEALWELAERLV
jgi:NAD(P)-dependent dehydrogenase (short-subunit alcohol dehydrogenase family)